MKKKLANLMCVALAATLVLSFSPAASLAAGTQKAQAKNFTFTYSSYLTNGKGSAYKSYVKMYKAIGIPKKAAIVYKARIKGNKLYVSGTLGRGDKVLKVTNKAYTLTSKTKYYQHTGNGSYYYKSSKKAMKKLLANKPKTLGGNIAFKVKNGKVTLLSAQ